MNLKQKTEVKA